MGQVKPGIDTNFVDHAAKALDQAIFEIIPASWAPGVHACLTNTSPLVALDFLALEHQLCSISPLLMEKDFTWLQSRDGSPTLWHNQLAEPFRSTKGAFSESWLAFVKPALAAVKTDGSSLVVGEFGLGAGTNWLIWSLATQYYNIPFNYYVIEKDTRSFELALHKWKDSRQLLQDFFAKHGLALNLYESFLESFTKPVIFHSLAKAQGQFLADIWFHDPFGFDVNPEGYSEDTLKLCKNLWKTPCHGFSYACNRRFQDALGRNGVSSIKVCKTGAPKLKKSRLEWSL